MLLITATLIVWGGVPWGAFQYDDFNNIIRDPATTDFDALAERLLHGLRPLARLSYFLDAKLFGLQPAGFLCTNLILHLATVLAVFVLARRRIECTGAFLAALFFAVQPANAEVVAYASGRSTALMTPLLLGGLLLHDRGRRVGSLIFFTLACLAKEVGLVFPAIVLIWDMTGTEPRVHKILIGWTIVAGAIFAMLISLSNYHLMLSYSFGLRSIAENILLNARAIPVMLSLWVRPRALSADHEFDADNHMFASILGLVFLCVMISSAFLVRRRCPLLAIAFAWPLLSLLPTNSIIAKVDPVTERPLYLAWVGPSLALGALICAATKVAMSRNVRRLIIVTVALVLCGLAGTSLWRATLWRDPTLLWLDAARKAPGKSRCWNNLGMAYLTSERDAEAVAAFERAIRLDPRNQLALSNLRLARLLCGDPCITAKSQPE